MGAIQALYGYEEGAGRVSEREGVCVCYCCNIEFFVIIAKSSGWTKLATWQIKLK